ncbi:MAG: hypothetical protein M1829_001085 [Trizodia sp. TS-e1964]|nr:MAG: hypothetical protein M1829_001085 [Trizodia sp. TS-e1964]
MAAGMLGKRQAMDDFGIGDDDWSLGPLAKGVLLIAGVILILIFIVCGRIHALQRFRRGLEPLFCHRWLLSRREREMSSSRPAALHQPACQNTPPCERASAHRASFRLSALPPPSYEASGLPPPSYQPPLKASKADSARHSVGEQLPGSESSRAPTWGAGGSADPEVLAHVPQSHSTGNSAHML